MKNHIDLKKKLANLLYRTIGLFLFLIAFSPLNQLRATHLIGGNMGYVYLGADSVIPGNQLFRVTLDSYIDCNSQAWGSTFPEPTARVGIYEGVLSPTTGIPFVQNVLLQLIDSNEVDPNLPPICDTLSLLSGVCVYLVRYEATVSVAPSNLGYWIIHDRCCRPGGIINLNNSGAQSFAYTTWIPADSTGIITNSTAQFNDTLLSYICRTDTAYISNSATDSDGDSLVYTLVDPFVGVTTSGNPQYPSYNVAALNPYIIPPSIVNYAAGFNLANLLGVGSFSSTNPNTGLTKFLTNIPGKFVAAVEIAEYRNGSIVGVTRRNMQLISDDCPNNNAPNQDISVLDSTALAPLIYQINAGDSFCFDLNYDDLDGDPLVFVASGDIFDPGITNPPATSNSPAVGVASVTGTICWATSCAQGSSTPYIVDIVVADSNCPPLPVPQTVQIIVNPFEGLQNIFGDSVVCVSNTPNIFTTDVIPGATYTWSVTNGSIVSGSGSSTVGITWSNSANTGSVSVSATNSNGCTIGPITKTVVLSNVVADAGPDIGLCLGDSVQIGGSPTSLNPNNLIVWTPNSTLNFDTVANPMAFPTQDTTYVVTLSNAFGCFGTDSVDVFINQLQNSGLEDEYYVCPGDSADPMAIGSAFAWSPNYNITDTTISSPQIYPDTSMFYFISYLDSNGCAGFDSIFITVNENVPTNAGPDHHICIGDTVSLGSSPTSPPKTTYLWSPNLGLDFDTAANPLSSPLASTTYIVQTFNDTCTGTDTVTVLVNQPPTLSTSNDTLICSGDSVLVNAYGIGDFSWSPSAILSNDSIANPIVFPDTTTTYFVTLTDSIGCFSIDSLEIQIQPLPLVDAGGIINGCKFETDSLGGNPTSTPGVSYSWGPLTGILNPDSANPTFNLGEDAVYYVTVTDSIGCANTDSVEVKIFRVTGLGDTTLCAKELYTLATTRYNGVGPFTYSWTNPSVLSDPNSPTPSITTGSVNSFTVTVTDANNCRDTVNFNIGLLASTTATFEHEVNLGCNGISVQIVNNSEDAIDYQWYVNGNLYSEEPEPELIFNYGVETNVTLITSSVDGCTDTAQVVIPNLSFEDVANIEAADVFTPNGDGVNDLFVITTGGDLAECSDLQIFNRHGVLVFQSTGGIFTWDGRSSTGELYSEGVYFYVFSVNGIEKHGNVTLLR